MWPPARPPTLCDVLSTPQVAFIGWAGVVILAWTVVGFAVLAPLYRSWSRRERLAYVLGGTAFVVAGVTVYEVVGAAAAAVAFPAYPIGSWLIKRHGYWVTDRDPSRREQVAGATLACVFLGAFFGGELVLVGHL